MHSVVARIGIGFGVLAAALPALVGAAPSQDELNTIAVFRDASRGVIHVTAMSVGPAGLADESRRTSVGTGFVLDHAGRLLTAYHVVKDRQRILATLPTGEEFVASVVGSSDEFDVALLRIDAPRELLFPLDLGDSTRIQVGQKVMAIGNGYGLHNSLSVGVISALGRTLRGEATELQASFIQTDAAINPGNSGGPLIDAGGRVIGINTLIVTQGVGQSSGVGFAVPINVAKAELAQLKEKGHVTRGWLGVQIQALDEDLSSSLGLKGTEGALVSDIRPGGPADKAGMKPGDVITRVNGTAVHTSADVSEMVSSLAPGEKAKLDVVRDGRERTLDASVGTFPEGREEASAGTGGERGRLGLSLRPLDDASAAHLDLPRGMDGLVVREVEPGSPAETAGLRPGDVIVGVDGREVSSRGDFEKAVDGRQPVRVRVYRGGGYLFLVLKPEDAPAQ